MSQGQKEVCIKSSTSYRAALVKEIEHPQPASIEQPVGLTKWLTYDPSLKARTPVWTCVDKERIQEGNSFSSATFISFGSLMESKKAARSHKRPTEAKPCAVATSTLSARHSAALRQELPSRAVSQNSALSASHWVMWDLFSS